MTLFSPPLAWCFLMCAANQHHTTSSTQENQIGKNRNLVWYFALQPHTQHFRFFSWLTTHVSRLPSQVITWCILKQNVNQTRWELFEFCLPLIIMSFILACNTNLRCLFSMSIWSSSASLSHPSTGQAPIQAFLVHPYSHSLCHHWSSTQHYFHVAHSTTNMSSWLWYQLVMT